MTANQRIVLNVVATYGRSLYALICGLFSARWLLNSLGEVDYGLYGLVGGLVLFVSFLNTILAGSVSRFYAYSEGYARTNPKEGLVLCQQWFNTALLILTTVATILMLIGYPIGEWAVRHYLTIPPDRIELCVWVWRFVCVACYINMVAVPFSAMYTAKQEIAELTVYSFAVTTLNVMFLYYMASHPEIVWLGKYALWHCLCIAVPYLIIAIRATVVYPECTFCRAYLWNSSRVKEVLLFAGSRLIGAVSQMCTNQGMAVLVNKLLGPVRNSAMTVGNNVSAQSLSLASSLTGAFQPAITNAAGEGDLVKMRELVYRMCTFASLSVLVFAVPLMLEAEEVLTLWLKTPPAGASALCVCMLVVALIQRLCDGHWIAIFALGRGIARFQTTESLCWFLTLPIAYVFMRGNFDIAGVGLSLIVANILALILKLYFGRVYCDLSIAHWLRRIFLPVIVITGASLLIGLGPRLLLGPSFLRVCLTTIVVECVLSVLAWFVALDSEDRTYLVVRLGGIRDKIVRKVLPHG